MRQGGYGIYPLADPRKLHGDTSAKNKSKGWVSDIIPVHFTHYIPRYIMLEISGALKLYKS